MSLMDYLNRYCEDAVEVDKNLAKDSDLVDVKSLKLGEIGIGTGLNGGGVYFRTDKSIIGLQTASDFTSWPYDIKVRKLPRGTKVTLIAG